ncbi:molecular chaperone [Empedobacter sp. GD03644]|uniref:molecular chaperone n=1 Tax=Empedobacter sp. GD03644 TaxID=2975358 RepID=UPI00244B42A2|nr:molecular chaperone [Empedobacter sp. GD03644]MDH2206222.1 molecular chaperone [Empedobacter sp. GD03644]
MSLLFLLMKVLRFLTIVSFLALIVSIKISAQSGISVSPPRTYFTLNPGESERKKIMVTNVSDVHTLELSVSFKDWKYDEFGGNVVSEPNTLPTSNANWITVLPSNTFTLLPKESKEIEVLMQVPEKINAESVHTTMMYITQTNPIAGQNKSGENIKISIRTGVKIYQRLNIARDTNVEFTNFVYDKTENRLVLNISNEGNVWSEGTIRNEIINQENGQQIKLQDAVFYSLPNDKRIVYIPLPKDLPKGSYIVTSTLSFEKDDQLKIAELTFSNDK